MTNLATRAIQAAETKAEAKEICGIYRGMVISMHKKYGPDHHITKGYDASHMEAVDEMADKFGKEI